MRRVLSLWAATAAAAAALNSGAGAGDALPGGDASVVFARMPAVSARDVAFVYAGDIWLVPRQGGTAQRLSTPPGEESSPRFSPEGTEIAFSANYEGNIDVYVMPVAGGAPRRITWHGAPDRMLCWWPDGRTLVFGSGRESFTGRVGQFFRIDARGGCAERLPIAYGDGAAVSPDGSALAFTVTNNDDATWKRYRGGMAPDIWVFDLGTGAAEPVVSDPANDSQPMWAGPDRLYFLSDREPAGRTNLWRCDVRTGAVRAVTRHADFDVRHPSAGPGAIVYEVGGRIHLLDLASERVCEVPIRVVTDAVTVRPRIENVSRDIRNAAISPTGKRALFEARGDIFSVPAAHGVKRNLTRSQGVAERYPTWSPDGRWVAYFSDRTGEYELTLRAADGKGGERRLTALGPGYRYRPQWAPDSRKIVFMDSAMCLWLHDIDAGATSRIDRQLWHFHGALEEFRVSWSADSRWIAYAGDTPNRLTAIVLFDVAAKTRHQVTSAFCDDDLPVFDPAGKYLYYRSKRHFRQVRSDFDNTWTYTNSHALLCVPLRRDIPSPLAPRNDEEPVRPETKKVAPVRQAASGAPTKPGPTPVPVAAPAAPPASARPAAAPANPGLTPARRPGTGTALAAKPAAPAPAHLRIDLDGFESRGVILPAGAGRLDGLAAVPGKVIFRWPPLSGSNTRSAPVSVYDLEARSEKRLVDDAVSVELSADGGKLLVARAGSWSIVPVASSGSGASTSQVLATGSLEMTVDPAAEWRQMYDDAWRIERDFFYDPAMHGIDWNAMRARYAPLLGRCATRHDVNAVLGELLGELSSSHTYRSGGDLDLGASRAVGYLGCDFAPAQGALRIRRILETAPWDTVHSPLRAPGLDVREGEYLLAVNGDGIEATREPWAAFQGLADQAVLLTINSKPNVEGARDVLVQTLASEANLRQCAWIEANRQRVEQATDGRAGYVYVSNTGDSGQADLYRQWRAQTHKLALVIDERWNSGGHTPDRFVELLARRATNYWHVRDGRDWTTPLVVQQGPKAMLINGWSGSGGDNFAHLFRVNRLGPLIGTRTWGGLIGITGAPRLVDGGNVTVPTFRIYDADGRWIIEGAGVQPDIEVPEDPTRIARGIDPQLERAIAVVCDALDKNPPHQPAP